MPFEKVEALPGFQHILLLQVTEGLGIFSLTVERQGIPFRDPQAVNNISISPHSSCWGIHTEIKLAICYISVGGLGPAHVCSLFSDSGSEISKGPG